MADVQMPLTAHLQELRSRLIKALTAVFAGFFVCYGFVELLFELLKAPLSGAKIDSGDVMLIGTGVAEAFFTKLKVAFIGGVFLAIPVILYQLWQFVVPALYDSEKQYARPFVIFGTVFFLLGAWFCYQVALPIGYVYFMQQYSSIGVMPQLRISEYLTFTARMLLAFGVTFELPVATFFLARVGLITHRTMIDHGRYAIVVIFIVAAVMTPPDVASQMLMAVPLLGLYALSIGVAYSFAQPNKVDTEREPPAV
ncbi:MAG TPA: twin-arginine translocase subunit TatC [Terriglobales bacterium]|nr:twin-arginine translocase subunit TatC [Terriglobales bacterium]